ncbi:hypothetical protein MKAN_05685 [Mycobacterium kansasii ATCC 12478]|uniref:Uncharacterized protein n=1 Tax=Mycobacterium kansasii ATCC 12478 TaxID=557599 RepID=U5X1K9_MYCKA|nr:hypothetical protein MKAN_05685 [Mycobacterium kansasii ATCC 12478]
MFTLIGILYAAQTLIACRMLATDHFSFAEICDYVFSTAIDR